MVDIPVLAAIDRMLEQFEPRGIVATIKAGLVASVAAEIGQPAKAPLLYREVMIKSGTPRLSDWEVYGVVEMALPEPEPEPEPEPDPSPVPMPEGDEA